MRGRQTELAKLFNVSPNGARKWLLGEGMPELEVAIRLARWADVNVEWLLTGRGPKRGAHLDTKALILSEALEALAPTDRHEVLGYFAYKVQHSVSRVITESQVNRYIAAINTYDSTDQKTGTKRH